MNSNWFPHTDFRALLSQMNPEATHPGGWNRRGRRCAVERHAENLSC